MKTNFSANFSALKTWKDKAAFLDELVMKEQVQEAVDALSSESDFTTQGRILCESKNKAVTLVKILAQCSLEQQVGLLNSFRSTLAPAFNELTEELQEEIWKNPKFIDAARKDLSNTIKDADKKSKFNQLTLQLQEEKQKNIDAASKDLSNTISKDKQLTQDLETSSISGTQQKYNVISEETSNMFDPNQVTSTWTTEPFKIDNLGELNVTDVKQTNPEAKAQENSQPNPVEQSKLLFQNIDDHLKTKLESQYTSSTTITDQEIRNMGAEIYKTLVPETFKRTNDSKHQDNLEKACRNYVRSYLSKSGKDFEGSMTKNFSFNKANKFKGVLEALTKNAPQSNIYKNAKVSMQQSKAYSK